MKLDLNLETDVAKDFFNLVKADRDPCRRVDFTADFGRQMEQGDLWLIETIKAISPAVEPVARTVSDHHRFDGERLILSLGPDDTADDRYSSVELASTPRFTQALLDYLGAVGSMRVMLPGRQATYRNVVFSEHFADGRAWDQTITSGCAIQSWRGIEGVGLTPETYRPRFIVAWIGMNCGPGLFPIITSGSWKKRHFFASVIDWNTGLSWIQPLPGYDPTVPSDITIRWLPNRNIEFLVNDRCVACYEDGQAHFYLPKLVKRQFGRGVDLHARRFLSADPCHLDFWLTCMIFGNVCDIKNGRRLEHEIWSGFSGYTIEPIW